MAWLESHQELRDHPKTKRLARMLGISLPAAIGHLHLLWWWAMDYAPDGDISDYDAYDIADAAGWEGEPEAFLDALINCGPGDSPGFVERDEFGMRLHDWDDYGNQYKERQAAAERKRRSRERRKTMQGMSRDSHVTVTGQEREVTADKTRPDQTGQDKKYKTPPSPSLPGSGRLVAAVKSNRAETMELERLFHERFWPAYPRKVAKKAALKAWLKIRPSPELVDRMLEALARQRASPQWTKDDGAYIPYPATWLNQARWEDEIDAQLHKHGISDFSGVPPEGRDARELLRAGGGLGG
ncbi:MAG: hypothetical protein IRZ18_06625 [Clostridia bacterium]|nr:hypothetical protein [Clostridia bacterium]